MPEPRIRTSESADGRHSTAARRQSAPQREIETGRPLSGFGPLHVRDGAASWAADPPSETGPETSLLLWRLRVLRARKWIVIQAVILLTFVAALLSLQQDARYSASAGVYLGDESLVRDLAGLPAGGRSDDALRDARTQADLARVPEVAARTLEAAGLRGQTVDDLLRSSRVSPRRDSDFLDFRVTDSSSPAAVRLANEYARQFTIYRSGIEVASVKRIRGQVLRALADLTRRGLTRGALYKTLSERERDLRTIATLQSPGISVVKQAETAKQIAPRPIRDIAIGLALGLLVGCALAFLVEGLDTRVRTASEVGAQLGLPLLGRLRAPPRQIESADGLVMTDDPVGSHAEAFRILRMNVVFANLDQNAQAILVTSAVNGEGKSTTVANLALAFARLGRKVVLVDLDLRNPALDRFFRLQGHPGLTDVALGHVALDDALVAVPTAPEPLDDVSSLGGNFEQVGTLEVLSAGPPPLDSGEFVSGNVVRAILAELRERAEVVLVDAPPLLPVGDALALSARVDATIVIANLSIVRRPMLKELRRALDACPARPLGFVLTAADTEREDRYGGYYRRRRELLPLRGTLKRA